MYVHFSKKLMTISTKHLKLKAHSSVGYIQNLSLNEFSVRSRISGKRVQVLKVGLIF